MSLPNLQTISEPRRAGWWDRVMVPRLIGCCCAQPAIMDARTRIIPRASGDVLEVGCGGGINLPLYDATRVTSLAGVDPSPELLEVTRAAAQRLGLAADLRGAVGEALPFADASFDCVTISFTLCSVDDGARVIAEMRRVLRPGGRILFLEHGSAPDADVARWQSRIEPLWKRLAGNCHLTRPIADAYRAAGLSVTGDQGQYMPKAPRPFGWIEWGEARA